MTINKILDIYLNGKPIEKNGKNRSFYYISLLVKQLDNINEFTLKNIFESKYFKKENFKYQILKFYCFVCKKLNIRRNEVICINRLISNKNIFSTTNSDRLTRFVLSEKLDNKHLLDLNFFFKKHFPLEIRDSLLKIKDFDIYFAMINSLSCYLKSHRDDILNVALGFKYVNKSNLTFSKFKQIFSATKYGKVMGIFFLNALKVDYIKDPQLKELKCFLDKNENIVAKNSFNKQVLDHFYCDNSSLNKIDLVFKHKLIKKIDDRFKEKYQKIKHVKSYENVLNYLDEQLKSNHLFRFNDEFYKDCLTLFFNKREERYYLSQIFLIAQELMSDELRKNNFILFKSKTLLNATKDDGYYIYLFGFDFVVPKEDKIKFIETANEDVFASNIVDYVLRIDFTSISENLRNYVKGYFCSKRWTLSTLRTTFNIIKSFDHFMRNLGENEITLNLVDRFNLSIKDYKKSYIRLSQIKLYGFFKYLYFEGFPIDRKALNLDTVVKEPRAIGVKHSIPTDEIISKIIDLFSRSSNPIDHICLQILRICDFYQPRLSEILALRIDNIINSSRYGNSRVSSPNKISASGDQLSVIIKEPKFYELVMECHDYNVVKSNGIQPKDNKFVFQFKNRDGYLKVPSTETVAKHFKNALLQVGADKVICNFMSIRRYFINKMNNNENMTLVDKKARARHTPKSKIHGLYLKLSKEDISYFQDTIGLIDSNGNEYIDSSKYNKELPNISKCLFCKNFYCKNNIKEYIDKILPTFIEEKSEETSSFEDQYVTTVKEKLIQIGGNFKNE